MRDDPGYYVTTLYQKRGVYWYRSDGRHGGYMFPAYEKWPVMWRNRRAELVARPEVDWHVGASSNDPAAGVRATAMGAKENTIEVNPQVGCTYISVHVLVDDSVRACVINFEPAGDSFGKLARRHDDVVPHGAGCDASIVWDTH